MAQAFMIGFKVSLICFLFMGWQTELLSQPVSSLVKNAERAAKSGHLQAAAELWERAGRLKNTDPALMYQAADAFAQAREYVRAGDCYKAALDAPEFPFAPLRYARVLKQQGRFEAAIQILEPYASNYQGAFKSVMQPVIENEIAGCQLGLKAIDNQDTTIFVEQMADSLCTRENEFAPIPFSDQLLYFSLATDNRAELLRSLKKEAAWGRAVVAQSLPESVSSRFSTGSFSMDGNRFYYSQCTQGCPAESGGSAAPFACAIYCLRRTEDGWAEPERLRPYINQEGSTAMFPHVSQADGLEYLCFSSDRTGGFGGLDLYICSRPLDSEQMDFSFPQNLGRTINTGADEVSPCYQAQDKVLWFSSLGHPALGGFDVFKSEKEENEWSKPENAGVPINSPADDYFFVLKKSGTGAFLASNRSVEGIKTLTTDDDIFEINWKQ